MFGDNFPDWLNPISPKKPEAATADAPTTSGGDADFSGLGGGGDMMEARRRALQQKREEQQRQQTQFDSSPVTSRTRPPAAGRLGGSHQESALPDVLFGDDDDSVAKAPSATAASAAVPPTTSASALAMMDPNNITEETLEALRVEVAARKKELQAARERESALQEKWRADKAKKRAEIHQIDAQLRTLWGEVEDEKSAGESKIRETQDRYETELRKARQELEKTLRAEYEPQIKEKQDKLEALKKEKEQLKSLLAAENESKDLINDAIASAITNIMGRLQTVFTDNASQTQQWNESVQELIRQEVRTSFAVTAGSEAQAEREEYKRSFNEMLDFWREAEEQERERITKMDDALLADLQRVAHEDLAVLQKEEQTMEEMYLASREAWSQQHQTLLQKELEDTLRRRQEELEEQRKLRHSLHAERLADIQARHRDQVAMEEALHHREMELLRAQFDKEEQLHDERQRAVVAAQREAAAAAENLQGVMASMTDVLASLKEYEGTVEQRRQCLDEQERKTMEQNDLALRSIQDMAATLTATAEEERREAADALSQLRLLGQTVEQHLQDEANWLAQQEERYRRDKEEWEREYRRWRQTVQRERQAAEDRFHEALQALQESASQLNAEERDINVEAAAMERAFADLSAQVDREKAALRTRQEELQKRQLAVAETVAAYKEKGEAITREWDELKARRDALHREREDLRADEAKLEQMTQALRLVRAQSEGMRCETVAAAERGKSLQHQLRAHKETLREYPQQMSGAPAARQATAARVTDTRANRPHHPSTRVGNSDPNRLPNKLLKELQRKLAAPPSYSAFRYVDPNAMAPPPQSGCALTRQEGAASYWAVPSSTPAVAASENAARANTHQQLVPAGTPPSTPQTASSPSDRRSTSISVPGAPPIADVPSLPARNRPATASPGTTNAAEPYSSASPMASQFVSDMSPSAQTFTNLVDFSEGDTMME